MHGDGVLVVTRDEPRHFVDGVTRPATPGEVVLRWSEEQPEFGAGWNRYEPLRMVGEIHTVRAEPQPMALGDDDEFVAAII